MPDNLLIMPERVLPTVDQPIVRFHIGPKAYTLQIRATIQPVTTQPGQVIEMPAARSGRNSVEPNKGEPE